MFCLFLVYFLFISSCCFGGGGGGGGGGGIGITVNIAKRGKLIGSAS